VGRLTILNVDDYEPGRYARTQLLREWGYDVTEAATGAEALRLAMAEHPALVILDVRLPDMDGFEVCRRLKSERDGAALPVLHVSATFTSAAHQVLGLNGGADGYLTEPVEPAVLRATIDALLRLRQAERALRTAARQWEVTFDGIAEGICLLDEGGYIIRCNSAFRRLVAPADPLGQSVEGFWDVGADDARSHDRIGNSGQREVIDVRRGDRWFRLTVDPIVDEGVALGAVCFVSEVTEARRLESERQLRFDAEQQAREEAESATRAKDDFLAVLGHELRTPLMPIAMAMRTLRPQAQADPAVAQVQAIVERQVHHIARLVDDLLDVARLTRRRLELCPERVDLRVVVTQALESTRGSVDAQGHELVVTLPDAPLELEVDPVRLAQVAVNLLGNAVKYTPAGGRITVTLAREGGDAVLRVRDTGVGISAEERARIFEPFAQSLRSSERSAGGLGIGLTLARGLVSAHGGTLSVSSEGPGRGSEFVVRLPVRSASPVSSRRPAPVAPPRGESVLIVEDHADSRIMLAEVLELEGHRVTAVSNGPAALEQAAASRPDVAIVDIGLSGMDGYETARRLRGAHGDAVFLVAVTGYSQAEDVANAYAAGFDAHIVKPFDTAKLSALLAARRRR
jgi:signal transduction histidine kinase/CheY-like chemotaxis protein